MNQPAANVCIIIAAYNAGGTVARAVASALAEPEVAEVVVVDDCSADSTIDTVRALGDAQGRLKLLIQPQNLGPAAARNRAIAESVSPWLGILDADDFFTPGRINNLLAHAENADLIADDMWQVPESDIGAPRKSLLEGTLAAPKKITFEEFVLSNVTRRRRDRKELGFIKPLMRREFLDIHQLRYKEHMRLGEDFELYARALGLGARLILIPAPGYVSVVREHSLSGRHSETDLLHLRDCDLALTKELALTPRELAAIRKHYASVDCRLQWRLLINAVKKRDPKAIMQAFLHPWPVPLYLIRQLACQAYARSFRRGAA